MMIAKTAKKTKLVGGDLVLEKKAVAYFLITTQHTC